MATKGRESDLMKQLKDAFNTLSYDDDFLGDEERQIELLQELRKHMRQGRENLDRRLKRGEAKAQKIKEQLSK